MKKKLKKIQSKIKNQKLNFEKILTETYSAKL